MQRPPTSPSRARPRPSARRRALLAIVELPPRAHTRVAEAPGLAARTYDGLTSSSFGQPVTTAGGVFGSGGPCSSP